MDLAAVSGSVGSRISGTVRTRDSVRDAHKTRIGRAGSKPALKGVSVVIPAKNEAKNIGWVLRRLPEVDEVILVDGQSTDGTVAVARGIVPDLMLVNEERPGKGAALRAGFDAASGDYVVMLDADGSMDPGEISLYVAKLQSGYDLVKGSRFIDGGGSTDISPLRRLGNRGLLGLANMLYRSEFTELCYGFMALRRSCVEDMRLKGDGFEIETEIVVNSVRAGLRVGEVPSFESPRRYGDSNLNTWRDGLRVLRTMIKSRLARWPRPVVERPLERSVSDAPEGTASEPVPLGGTFARGRLGLSLTLGVTALAPMAAIVGLRMLGVS